LLLFASACSEPTFVSLGRNIQSVASAGAGPDPDLFPFPDPTPDPDLASVESCSESPAADSPLSGCSDPTDPASCQLGNDPTTIDSACDTRHLVVCPSDLMSDPLRVNRLLTDLLGGCTERSHRLTVTFSAGCASAFSLEPIDAPGTESASGCVAAHLAAERYACAESLDCGFGSTFLIPTR
jgi:hypothetical protein